MRPDAIATPLHALEAGPGDANGLKRAARREALRPLALAFLGRLELGQPRWAVSFWLPLKFNPQMGTLKKDTSNFLGTAQPWLRKMHVHHVDTVYLQLPVFPNCLVGPSQRIASDSGSCPRTSAQQKGKTPFSNPEIPEVLLEAH